MNSRECSQDFLKAEGGVTLCQSEGTHQIIMSFSLPVVCIKKAYKMEGVEGSQAPQDSLVMRLHRAQCV